MYTTLGLSLFTHPYTSTCRARPTDRQSHWFAQPHELQKECHGKENGTEIHLVVSMFHFSHKYIYLKPVYLLTLDQICRCFLYS